MKRLVLSFALACCIALSFGSTITAQKGGHQGTARLDLVEATVPELLKALQTGLITSVQIEKVQGA